MTAGTTLRLTGRTALEDLATYIGRAARVDPGGAARLVVLGDVLAAYVSPVHGGGGPTVLGLRTVRLAAAADVDTTVPLAALADRFARIAGGPLVDVGAWVDLSLPPQEAGDAAWAGVSPPRTGWELLGTVPESLLRSTARAGVDEVAAGAGEGSAALAVARLRALVWGRDVAGAMGLPAGAAYAADALGFVVADEPVALYRAGSWRRLTTTRGHVLARGSALL